MSIDRLSSTAALIAALRGDATRKSGANQSTSSATTPTASRHPAKGRPDIAKLRSELAKMVKDVRLDDAEAIRELRPRMVRSILLWEFGPRLREHPDWRPMLDNIVRTLESDPSQLEGFVTLVGELKRQK